MSGVGLPAAPTGVSLRLAEVWKVRGDEQNAIRIEIPALSVAPGEFLAIRGGNGSGKSTLLDILGLILRPDGATQFHLLADGEVLDLTRASATRRARVRRRYLGYVLQSGGLLNFLTLRDNIRFGALIAGRPVAGVEALAEEFGLTRVLSKHPGRVSGGQRQKAALARALMQRSPVVLADEPTASLDAQSAATLLGAYRRLTDAGAAVVMVTHDEALARGAADRVLAFETATDEAGRLRSVLRAA